MLNVPKIMLNVLKIIHDYLIDADKLRAELNWIVKVWYIILVVGGGFYVIKNFEGLSTTCFYDTFDGNSIIFLLWLVLLIIPFFDSFEGFGVKIHKHRIKEDKELNQLSQDVMQKGNSNELEELITQFNDINKEENNE